MSKTAQTTQPKVIDNNNLPKTLLQAKANSQFITIPQTTIDEKTLHNAIKATGKASYLLTKLEHHENGGLHIHIVIRYKERQRISFIHNLITTQVGQIGGLIDYQQPKNLIASIQYLKKAETSVEGHPFMEHGDTPTELKRIQNKDDKDTQLLAALEKAEQGDTEGALADIKAVAPLDYLKFKQQINATLLTENKTILKYELPSFAPEDVKLNPKQQEVWDLLQQTPQTRRIIWVTGEYGSGKSFLYNYIKANHKYRMYDAGQSASLDNVVYGYDEEGVIAWDLPRTFNFDELGNSIAAVIEKFSDFGQSITSKKYSGKTQHVRGHAVVFSNHPPIDQLTHREVRHIDLTIPKTQPDTARKLKHKSSRTEETLVCSAAVRQSFNEKPSKPSALENTLILNPPLNKPKKHTIIRVESDDEQDPDYEYWSTDRQQEYDRTKQKLKDRTAHHNILSETGHGSTISHNNTPDTEQTQSPDMNNGPDSTA